MEISIIGVGRLGLCFALNLEKAGHRVTGYDINEDYIKSLCDRTFLSFEPGVNEMLSESSSLFFSSSLEDVIAKDIIFICVDTPSTDDYRYDHKKIDAIVDQIISYGISPSRKELIINSTTFPGYCSELQKKLSKYNYCISYNPEFIAQGTILRDQVNCDHVLIGEYDEKSGDIIQEIYESFCLNSPVYNRMQVTEAEITKLATNCFLTTKISFANMIGDIVIKYGGNPETVLRAIGSDARIGNKYLSYGFGFGGPCFPRDNRALCVCAKDVGIEALISKATDDMNHKHLDYQIEEFIKNNPDKKSIVKIPFVTYKKESYIIEESQQLKFAIRLKGLGYKIEVEDERPEVLEKTKDLL